MLDLGCGCGCKGFFGVDFDKEKVSLAKNLRGTVINKRYKIGATEIKEKV